MKKLPTLSPDESEELLHIAEVILKQPRDEAKLSYARMMKLLRQRDFGQNKRLYGKMMLLAGEFAGRNSDVETAAHILEEILIYANNHKLPEIRNKAMANLAVVKAQTNKLHEALDVWMELLPLETDPYVRTTLWTNISTVHGILGNQHKAIESSYKALQIAEESKSEEDMISPYINLGNAYVFLEDHDRALKAWQQALKLSRKHQDNRKLINCLNNISLIYNHLGDQSTAMKYALECIQISHKYLPNHCLGNPYNNVGYIYETSGDLDKALKHYKLAENYLMQHEERHPLANCRINQASIYLKKEDYNQALEILSAVEHDLETIESAIISERLLYHCASAHSASGNFQTACQYYQKLYNLQKNNVEKLNKNSIPITEAEYYRNKISQQAKLYKEQNLELKQRNKTIHTTSKELMLKNQDLANTVEVLNWLVSVISHDVRAPLANYSRIVQMMLDGSFEPDEHNELLSSLLQSSEHLLKLVNEMLDGIRLQRKKLDEVIVLESQDIAPILQEIAALYRPIAQQKNLIFNLEIATAQLMAKADQDLLKIVIRNLLNNAMKFTPKEGFVTLRAEESKDFVDVHIIDSGVGIDKDDLRLLRRGLYLNKNQPKGITEQGIGLGLTLIRDSLKRMKGKLLIHSKTGKGSRFTIRLAKG